MNKPAPRQWTIQVVVDFERPGWEQYEIVNELENGHSYPVASEIVNRADAELMASAPSLVTEIGQLNRELFTMHRFRLEDAHSHCAEQVQSAEALRMWKARAIKAEDEKRKAFRVGFLINWPGVASSDAEAREREAWDAYVQSDSIRKE